MRNALRLFVMAGLIAAAMVTGFGFLSPWWPQAEIVNHFRPVIGIGAAMLLTLSLFVRSRWLRAGSALLFLTTLVLLLIPLRYQAIHVDRDGYDLRVVSLNTWIRKGQADRIEAFIEDTAADIVLLQEVGRTHRTLLLNRFRAAYHYIYFNAESSYGPAILSKAPWVATGVVSSNDRKPFAVWARFRRGERVFEVVSVHLANPLEPVAQAEETARLIDFVRTRDEPIILGGDLNLTPFSWKLLKLAHQTKLRWAQTFAASWPANKWLPFVLIDHVLLSNGIGVASAKVGGRVGSDHLPVVADLYFEGS